MRSNKTTTRPGGDEGREETAMTHITHTEILVLAISALNAKIEKYSTKFSPEADALSATIIAPLQEKRETLMQLYKIETGEDYA